MFISIIFYGVQIFASPTAFVSAPKATACLASLLPLTDNPSQHVWRQGVDKPTLSHSGNAVILPALKSGVITGFFVYTAKTAGFYDSVEFIRSDGTIRVVPISKIPLRNDSTGTYNLIELVAASPVKGQETVTIGFMPGFSNNSFLVESSRAVLGTTLLPIIGLLLTPNSKSQAQQSAYANPLATSLSEADLKHWIQQKAIERQPTSKNDEVKIERRLANLTTQNAVGKEVILRNLKTELRIRASWIGERTYGAELRNQLQQGIKQNCLDLAAELGEEEWLQDFSAFMSSKTNK